jgi:hypothetical protein
MSDDLNDDNFASIRFERPQKHPGKYTVFASAMIGGKAQLRRLECNNPAYGWAHLEGEISELMLAHARAKRARRKTGLGTDND